MEETSKGAGEPPQKAARPRGRPRHADAEPLALAAVARLLISHPVHLITMELVAEHSGVSKLTLYRRWPSRLALLVDAMLERVSAKMVLDTDRPPADSIRAHIVSMVTELRGPTGMIVRGIVGACLADPTLSDVLRRRYLGHRRETAMRIIERGQADGSFAATAPPDQLADLLYGLIWYRFLFQVGEMTRKQALSVFATVLAPTR